MPDTAPDRSPHRADASREPRIGGRTPMNGRELATAVPSGAATVVMVIDNGRYGTIRMHRERAYPGRVADTRLVNPDFTLHARAFGGHGERAKRTEAFAPPASGRPAILHGLLDPRAQTQACDLAPAQEPSA